MKHDEDPPCLGQGYFLMTWTRFFGIWVVASVFLALLNFILKQISREYGKMLTERDPVFAGQYKAFMRFMVKNHRFFGMAAFILLMVHFSSAYLSGSRSLTGVITGAMLVILVSLGGYGFYVNRDYRAVWLQAHRGAAFLLAVSAIVHIIDRIVLTIRL